jgi:signal transduction histidine kinase
VRDLVALSTLPAVWAQSGSDEIGESLVDVLVRMLLLDGAYVRVRLSGRTVEAAATAAGRATGEQAAHLCHAVGALVAAPDPSVVSEIAGFAAEEGLLRAVCIPLGYDAANGAIVAASARPEFPSQTDRLLLGVAANAAAVVLERRKAEEHLREDKRTVDTLHRIGATLASELDRQKLIQMVTDEATALTGAEFGAFFFNMQNPQGGAYMLYTVAGVDREAFAKFPMPRATDLFGPTFRGERPVRLDDVTSDPRYGNNPPYHGMPPGHLPVRSYLAVPVLSRSGAVHGGLFFGHRDPGVFTERDERIASGVASWAGLALDNADLYRELQDANRAKDEFLATVSHELRTPLNAVLGWATMLSQGLAEGEQAQVAIAAIHRNAWAQVRLIEDLLEVSRYLAGTTRLELAEVNVCETVNEAIEAVRLGAEGKGLVVEQTPMDAELRMRGDTTRLRQILWNLLTNAIKFTPRGGRVTVSAVRDGDHIVFTVRDTGEGIDPSFLPHVFDRFRQADASTTRTHGGLGLGLWVVRHLAQLHGGEVHAESGGAGQGSTFVVRLPTAGAPAPGRLQ